METFAEESKTCTISRSTQQGLYKLLGMVYDFHKYGILLKKINYLVQQDGCKSAKTLASYISGGLGFDSSSSNIITQQKCQKSYGMICFGYSSSRILMAIAPKRVHSFAVAG